jgi:hypothetical protein
MRWAAISAVSVGVAVLAGAPSSARQPACAVPKRPELCRGFAAFRRPARSADRLPRIFHDDEPFPHLVLSSSRRLRAGKREVFLVGGKYVCLVDYQPDEDGGGYICNPPGPTLKGQTQLQAACEPPPRRHRLLLLQLLPDGVRFAAVRRVGKPALRFRVRNNLLFADLRVPSRAYLPKQTVWRRHGSLHRFSTPPDDQVVTCRARGRTAPARSRASGRAPSSRGACPPRPCPAPGRSRPSRADP